MLFFEEASQVCVKVSRERQNVQICVKMAYYKALPNRPPTLCTGRGGALALSARERPPTPEINYANRPGNRGA